MHRALDPSMERVLRTEQYLFNVSGISGNPSRLTRGDGFIYLSDLAPQMRFLANAGDRARYIALRAFLQDRMLRQDPDGLVPARSFRAGAPFEPATPYGYRFLNPALRDAWQQLADTGSAQLLAQIKWREMPSSAPQTPLDVIVARCAGAMVVVATNQAPGRAELRDARVLLGSAKRDAQRAAAGIAAVEDEVQALSCLTRLGVALNDPDATVRYLDHLLDHLSPLQALSGRPSLGTTADVLLTMRQVRSVGPRYYEPAPARSR